METELLCEHCPVISKMLCAIKVKLGGKMPEFFMPPSKRRRALKLLSDDEFQ